MSHDRSIGGTHPETGRIRSIIGPNRRLARPRATPSALVDSRARAMGVCGSAPSAPVPVRAMRRDDDDDDDDARDATND